MSAVAATPSRSRPRPKRRVKDQVLRLLFWVLVVLIAVYTLFPFVWAVRSSVTPNNELFTTPIHYWPSHPTLHNFSLVLHNTQFLRALVNSTIVCGSVTVCCLAVSASAGYALGRFRFRGKGTVKVGILAMTMFPQIAILGSLYTLVTRFNLFDSLWALVISYVVFTLPFTVWVLTSFIEGLPKDLEEAAYVDGASPLKTFYRIFLPLIAPALVTTGLLAFIAAWNEFLYALSFEQSPDNFTVPVAMANFTGDNANSFEVPWGQIMAATVVITVPLITLTLVLQRRIISGLTAGAVKG